MRDVEAALDARMFSAAPDAAVSTLETRSEKRVKPAVVIPLVGAPLAPGFALRVPGFVELHNFAGSAIPSELWRGHVGVEGSWGWSSPAANGPLRFYRATVAFEHESDHVSVGRLGGFLNLNFVALRDDVVVDLGGRWELLLALTSRLHLHTCTLHPALCSFTGGDTGSQAFELQGDATVTRPIGDSPFVMFASLHGARVFRHEWVVDERRALVQIGTALRTESKGTFQLFGTGFAGTDVGYFRGRREIAEFGVGIRWSP